MSVVASVAWSQGFEQGEQAFARRDYQEAARLFEIAASQSRDCKAFFYLGLSQYRLSEWNKAIISFESAVQCNPKMTNAQVALAEAYALKGNLSESLTAYLRALELEPANLPALRGAASIYMETEQNDKALRVLEKLTAANESSASAHADLGAVYAAVGNREAAIAQFRRALQLQPGNASALVGWANVYLKEGSYQEAVPLLQQAIRSTPNAFEPHFLMGSAFSRLGKFSDALSELQIALRTGGETPEIYYRIARVYGALGREDERREALSHFAVLSKKTRDDEETQRAAARLMEAAKSSINSGDLSSAEEKMQEACRLRPADDKVLFRLTGLEYDLKKYDSARAYVQEAINLAPSQWLYHFLLGLVEKDSGHFQAAEDSLTTAASLNPSAAAVKGALEELHAARTAQRGNR